MDWISENWPVLAAAISALLAAGAALAKLTKTQKDDQAVARLTRLWNRFTAPRRPR